MVGINPNFPAHEQHSKWSFKTKSINVAITNYDLNELQQDQVTDERWFKICKIKWSFPKSKNNQHSMT